eukprot:482203_1
MVYNILLVILFSMHWYMANSWISTRSDFAGVIAASNEGIYGSWSSTQFCNEGTFGKGYSLSVEPEQGVFADDTAVNSLTLMCSNNEQIIGSNGAPWGSFGSTGICSHTPEGLMNGFKQNTDKDSPSSDNTGLNDVNGHCNDGLQLYVNNGHGSWGSWSNFVLCNVGSAICGFSQKVDSSTGDATAMNAVRFSCCFLPTTRNPTIDPTVDPSIDPTMDPTIDPSIPPTIDPTIDPTMDPSIDPTIDPTIDPSSPPTIIPSASPTIRPSQYPTARPSNHPSARPSNHPTARPTIDPTSTSPTTRPSNHPTARPSNHPSVTSYSPTARPSNHPTARPSNNPTVRPSKYPTAYPSNHPTARPSTNPTARPSNYPTAYPSNEPTARLSKYPTAYPSNYPTARPSTSPTARPSNHPTARPSN